MIDRKRQPSGIPVGGQYAVGALGDTGDLVVPDSGPQQLNDTVWQYEDLTIDTAASGATLPADFFVRNESALDAIQDAGVTGRLMYRQEKWLGGVTRESVEVTLPNSGHKFSIYLHDDGTAGSPVKGFAYDNEWREHLAARVARETSQGALADVLGRSLRGGKDNRHVKVGLTEDYYHLTYTPDLRSPLTCETMLIDREGKGSYGGNAHGVSPDALAEGLATEFGIEETSFRARRTELERRVSTAMGELWTHPDVTWLRDNKMSRK